MPHADPEKRRAYKAAYYAAHREELCAKAQAHFDADPQADNARCAAYYAKNKERECAKRRARRIASPEKARVSEMAYNMTHREERCAYAATAYAADPEKFLTKNAVWAKAHPELKDEARQRHRALKHHALINDFTAAQWVTMQAAYDHRCVYCGKRAKGHLTQDHITPLSQGGNHTLSNIVPACRSCNSRKKAGPVLAPVQPLLL